MLLFNLFPIEIVQNVTQLNTQTIRERRTQFRSAGRQLEVNSTVNALSLLIVTVGTLSQPYRQQRMALFQTQAVNSQARRRSGQQMAKGRPESQNPERSSKRSHSKGSWS